MAYLEVVKVVEVAAMGEALVKRGLADVMVLLVPDSGAALGMNALVSMCLWTGAKMPRPPLPWTEMDAMFPTGVTVAVAVVAVTMTAAA